MSRYESTWHTYKEWDDVVLTPEEITELMTPVAEEDAWAVVGDMKYLTAETLAVLQKRAALWKKKYPHGEPMAKRYEGYVTFAHTCDVAEVLKISMRKAQKMLQVTRQFHEKHKNSYVSVKEFCFVNNINEDEFRKGLSLLE